MYFKVVNVTASESCALDLIEAEFIREIEPAEMIVCNTFIEQACPPAPGSIFTRSQLVEA